MACELADSEACELAVSEACELAVSKACELEDSEASDVFQEFKVHVTKYFPLLEEYIYQIYLKAWGWGPFLSPAQGMVLYMAF